MAPEKKPNVNPNLILPVGTQVVTLVEIRARNGQPLRRSGAVGKIVKAPTDNKHAYLVQFLDGGRTSLHREEIAIRKHVQNLTFDRPDAPLGDYDLYEYIIYRCVVGSRAYGLEVEESDVDRRGIYLPPARLEWSLYGVPEQIEHSETQECYWELQKFLVLALKANPNVLECLYTPLVEFANPIAQELLDGRSRFLSKLVYQTYNGYVMSQFRKLEQDLRNQGQLKWKHVMHLVRLLLSGVTILQDNFVPVEVKEHRDRLMSIRQGQVTWEDVNQWRLELHTSFDQAYETTTLPDRPDYDWANNFLISRTLQDDLKMSDNTWTMPTLRFHERKYIRLRGELVKASETSHLPELPTAEPALDSLLRRLRLNFAQGQPRLNPYSDETHDA